MEQDTRVEQAGKSSLSAKVEQPDIARALEILDTFRKQLAEQEDKLAKSVDGLKKNLKLVQENLSKAEVFTIRIAAQKELLDAFYKNYGNQTGTEQ